jgi:hypothetical protein
LLKRREEEDVLNAKIIAKNKGSTLEIKNEAPCYWVDKKKKNWQKFWCNDEGVFHQTRLINEEEVTRVCLPQKYIADALKLVHEEGHWGHHPSKGFILRWPSQNLPLQCNFCHTRRENSPASIQSQYPAHLRLPTKSWVLPTGQTGMLQTPPSLLQ